MGILEELPPGDSLETMIDATDRIIARLKRRAFVAKNRFEKDPTPENSSRYLSSSQEYFYMTFTIRLLDNFAKRLAGPPPEDTTGERN